MQPEATIQAPETEGLRQEALSLVERTKTLSIRTNTDYEAAGAELVRVATIRRNITTAFAEPKKKAFEAHRAITKLEADLLRIPGEAETAIKRAMGTYRAEEEKRRREEEAKIAAQLRRQEEDRRLAEAEALSTAGHQAEAEALIEQPILAPVVELERPKAEGVSMRRKWAFRIIDEKAISRDFLTPDEKKIRQTVTALGIDATKLVGGIEVYEDQIVAVRT